MKKYQSGQRVPYGVYASMWPPNLRVVSADGEPLELEMEHLGPGLYRASFPIEKYGEFYRMLVVHKQGDDVVDLRAIGVTESYSPEFRTPVPDEELLRTVARETGGSFAPDAEGVWTFSDEPARTPQDTWWWWLMAAAFLLPIDIASRRMGT